jgi:hypothetical protein
MVILNILFSKLIINKKKIKTLKEAQIESISKLKLCMRLQTEFLFILNNVLNEN